MMCCIAMNIEALDDLTVEKIKTGHYKSHLRNKQIATIFKELELIEK